MKILSRCCGTKSSAVDNAAVDLIAEFVKRAADYAERVSFIVGKQIAHVLEQKCTWTFRVNNSGDIEEERALRFACEAVGTTEGILLRYSGEAEGLAGEPREKNVVIGDVDGLDLRDVPGDLVGGEVRPIGCLRIFVPLAGENAFRADRFEAEAHTADSREEIDKEDGIFHA